MVVIVVTLLVTNKYIYIYRIKGIDNIKCLINIFYAIAISQDVNQIQILCIHISNYIIHNVVSSVKLRTRLESTMETKTHVLYCCLCYFIVVFHILYVCFLCYVVCYQCPLQFKTLNTNHLTVCQTLIVTTLL